MQPDVPSCLKPACTPLIGFLQEATRACSRDRSFLCTDGNPGLLRPDQSVVEGLFKKMNMNCVNIKLGATQKQQPRNAGESGEALTCKLRELPDGFLSGAVRCSHAGAARL